jgi:acylglycerol lipase
MEMKYLRVLLIILMVLSIVVVGSAAAAAFWPCSFPGNVVPGGALAEGQAINSDITPPAVGYVPATDGVRLAYYAYIPHNPIATLVFYHGSGANSAAGYLPIGQELRDKYSIATYLVDLRGHGMSEGPRGDAPSQQQVWQDVGTIVQFVQNQYPSLPLFLGGHSAGVGVILNSLAYSGKDVSGYVFLAPDFGLKSDTEQVAGASNFASVCLRAFIVNGITQGALAGHEQAVRFAYTPEEVRSAALVQYYTVNMALAQNPSAASQDLASLDRPFGLWIGSKDEVFVPDKVLAYAQHASKVIDRSQVEIVPGQSHLGILDNAAALIGQWITDLLKE